MSIPTFFADKRIDLPILILFAFIRFESKQKLMKMTLCFGSENTAIVHDYSP